MVDRLRVLLRRIDPVLEHLKNEEIVLVHQTSVGDLAFEIGETLCYQGRRNSLGWHRCQTEFLELLHVAAGAVADFHNLRRQLESRNGGSRTVSSLAMLQSCNRHC